MNSNKQPVGLKLTSMSGEQTHYEVTTMGSTGGKKNYYLIDTVINYIMGINKPIDLSISTYLIVKVLCNLTL